MRRAQPLSHTVLWTERACSVLTMSATKSSRLGFQFVSFARAHVDGEENVELDERRQHQEHGVHGETSSPHCRVQLELVEPEGEIEHQQRGQQRYR